ncbi:MAG: RNA polymerase sigma factor FliA [Betaproteobacteria bacterium]|nr:RNA polymerase sigma factor FliA [Betaproteobacteria bacterium]
MTNASIEQCVVQFAPLVKRLAYYMMASLPPSVEIDDVIQSGMMGLLDAAKRFKDTFGAQFETYAVQRIRGAMLDGLRQSDWLPRGLRKSLRQVETTISRLEQKNGRPPTETELAAALGMALADYQQLLQDARGYQLVSSEDLQRHGDESYIDHYYSDDRPDPLQSMLDDDRRHTLIAAIEDLPDREKKVMGLYYEQELNLREIGDVLGVSESRVCQLHTQAIARLRSRLRDN